MGVGKYMTQWMKVLQYVREHGVATSNELRSTLKIVDVPKVISILRKKGYPITAKHNADGSASYYYDGQPNPSLTHFSYVGTNAEVHQGLEPVCKICHRESEQLAI